MMDLDDRDDAIEQTAPVWAVFGDLMSGLLGAFVLILVGMLVVQMDLVSSLKQEVEKRQQEEQRRIALEHALAGPLASGRVTLSNGRIGISGSVLFAPGSDALRPEARELLISKGLQNKPQSDAYLRFLVQELKPLIDARYPTHTGPEHTAIMGSSMGGLISVYAMNEYPQVFGRAAGLSTHWIGGFEPNSHMPLAAYVYLRDTLADPATHRLYQDHGTTELDALYAPYQVFVNQIVRDRGYTDKGAQANFMTRVFEGTGHNEKAWAERLEIPLLFLWGAR